MARLVMVGSLMVCWLFSASQGALALGPGAPFTPPGAPSSHNTNTVETLAQPDSSGLTGIKLGRHPQALVDGQWISVGAVHKDAVLVSVGVHDVTLRHANGTIERLTLASGIELKRTRKP